jgi:hypothetical protein
LLDVEHKVQVRSFDFCTYNPVRARALIETPAALGFMMPAEGIPSRRLLVPIAKAPPTIVPAYGIAEDREVVDTLSVHIPIEK